MINDDNFLKALLPNLDRCWLNGKLYATAAGVAVASLYGLYTDSVAGTRTPCRRILGE